MVLTSDIFGGSQKLFMAKLVNELASQIHHKIAWRKAPLSTGLFYIVADLKIALNFTPIRLICFHICNHHAIIIV